MNFDMNLIFLIKSLFPYNQKVGTKFKYLENKNSFYDKIKTTFHHFQRNFIEANKGPYIKYVGGRAGAFLWGSLNISGID